MSNPLLSANSNPYLPGCSGTGVSPLLLDVPPSASAIQANSILLLLLGYPPTFHRISPSLSHPSLTSSFQSFTSPPPYLFPISSSLHTPFFRWSSRLTVCCYPGSCLLPCARVRLWFPSHFPPPRSTVAISGLLGCKNIVYRRSAGIGTTSSPVDPSAMHVGSSVKIL